MRIGIVGLGKLGLPMAALFASRGFDVIGVDLNEEIVGAVKRGKCPIQETGLDELMGKVKFDVTNDIAKAAQDTTATFIMVPTPSGEDGAFVNDYVLSALEKICLAMADKENRHIVVITSTVMPGSCQNVFLPYIENATGKEVGVDIGLAYNPEFIALGSVIRDMSRPDAILIGESDIATGDWLQMFYKRICENDPSVARMSLWNAEIAKMALNVFVTAKISLANTFARVCELIPGGDVDKVAAFLGMDSRIGPKYLQSGLGFGGTCFPRDSRAFIKMASEFGAITPIQEAVDELNESMPSHVALKITELAKHSIYNEPKTAAMLGLTYKPDTPVVEESRAVKIISELLGMGMRVKVHDPQGMENARKVFGDMVVYSESPADCIKSADIAVVATAWEDYIGMDWQQLKRLMRTPVILDCWRVLRRANITGIDYHALGVSDEKGSGDRGERASGATRR